jgi:hypothetical protein
MGGNLSLQAAAFALALAVFGSPLRRPPSGPTPLTFLHRIFAVGSWQLPKRVELPSPPLSGCSLAGFDEEEKGEKGNLHVENLVFPSPAGTLSTRLASCPGFHSPPTIHPLRC